MAKILIVEKNIMLAIIVVKRRIGVQWLVPLNVMTNI